VKPRAILVATPEPARQAKATPMITMMTTNAKNPKINKVNVPKISPNISKTNSQFTPSNGVFQVLDLLGAFYFLWKENQKKMMMSHLRNL
jgi:hypothetical protein